MRIHSLNRVTLLVSLLLLPMLVAPAAGAIPHLSRYAASEIDSDQWSWPQFVASTATWSGYAISSSNTAHSYTAAAGTWVVPAAVLPAGFTVGYSASWVGIGGICLDRRCSQHDPTLIQLGTAQNVTPSGSHYSAWYELLPNLPVTIPLRIQPGDTMVASLQVTNLAENAQTWKLTITDQNPRSGGSWSGTVDYNSSLASAEWIEEVPLVLDRSGVRRIPPLANYGMVSFVSSSANSTNPGLTAANAMIMYNPNGQTSNPSVPDRQTGGFNVCWGSGTTLNDCPAPNG